jgi:putative ABC transport system permease protein
MLLIASGLLIRSFIRIQSVDLGFRTDNLLTMQISLPRSKYPENQVAAFYKGLLREVESRPGVESAAVISDLPLRPSDHGALFVIEGRQPAPGEMAPQAAYRVISPRYFKTMGTALNRGRYFNDQDFEQTSPVVIIDENTARRFWPGGDAVDKRLALTFEKKENGPQWREIVGVVAHIKEAADEDKGTCSYTCRNSRHPRAPCSLWRAARPARGA